MNRSLLAAALAAATFGGATSAMALTFTDGNFTGGVDMSGTVTVPVSTNQWQWATGDAVNFPSIPVTQMSNGFKTLTLPVTSNLPLLVGQTKAATIGNTGNVGLNPQIVLKDTANATVAPVWDTTGNTGKGTLTLPVTAADGTTALGSMTIKVKAGTVRAVFVGGGGQLQALFPSSSGTPLYGNAVTPVSILQPGSIAGAWNVLLGAKSPTDLRDQLNAASGATMTTFGVDNQVPSTGFNQSDTYFAGTYGLGIAQGDTIVVNFTNPISANTTWKAPLKMTVTYL
ncbi:hypothetical protein KBJ94_27895 [Pseudomonas sp. ITA]|uniref:F4 family fimbrial subunit n=1 Tax=Pseudomonas sp. ITA TaxID=2825841 RepID=UPI002498D194|nr:hypothetical protein [Pseudomonas sp. ITA]MDI2145872.1 hypothetical protein [Pseudomonas sp. ITA]